MFISDSVPADFAPAALRDKLAVIGCAGSLAQAISHLHRGEPLIGDIP